MSSWMAMAIRKTVMRGLDAFTALTILLIRLRQV
jgi:hypothetical protein